MVTWEKIISDINRRNLVAIKRLNSLGIKSILKQTQDRNYDAVRDVTGRFFIEVHPKDFPYDSTTSRYNGSGTLSTINGYLLYMDDYLEIRTSFSLPWSKYNLKLLQCPLKMRRSIGQYIKWFYQNNILKDLKTKKELVLREKLTKVTNKVIKYLTREKITMNIEFEFMKSIREWEKIRHDDVYRN